MWLLAPGFAQVASVDVLCRAYNKELLWAINLLIKKHSNKYRHHIHILYSPLGKHMMIYSEKLSGPRTICCTHYFHSLLLHHNTTTSDIVPTHCSYLNI